MTSSSFQDTCAQPGLLPIADALAQMRASVRAQTMSEDIALEIALDRILAEDILARLDHPPQDNAAMDGYALRSTDQGPRRLVGRSLAGHPFTDHLNPGEAVRVTTGAVIPAGADSVVMQEYTQLDQEHLQLLCETKAGDHIRLRGEDTLTGSQLLTRGQRLGPVQLAILASQGYSRVRVFQRLKVALVSTGDELVPPSQPLAPGQIYDSNRQGLKALLERAGFDVLDLGKVADDPVALSQAFLIARENAQALVSSGGVSVGDADFVKPLLEQLGKITFWKLAIKPGKPFAFGHLGQCQFFGLPGNPVSAIITLQQLAIPILRQMAGEVLPPPLMLRARATSAFKKQPGRTDYQRVVIYRADDGQLEISCTGPQGSGQLSSFIGANAYAILEAGRGNVEAGEWVDVMLFDELIR